MKLKMLSLAIALVLVNGLFVAQMSATAQKHGHKGASAPVTGTFTRADGSEGKFTGTFTVQRFAAQDGKLVAIGRLHGLRDESGKPLQSNRGEKGGKDEKEKGGPKAEFAAESSAAVIQGNQLVTLPVTQASGSCQILNLVLGPLDLNLLGLKVHLDTVKLDISAQPGSGNLLGNLLCDVAKLLDGGGLLSNLTQIVSKLNQILSLL